MPQRTQASIEYDSLTKLPSMIYFRQYAGAYVRYGHKFGQEVYLIYFNLENFSAFNERYGFNEGDKLLNLMAVAIQTAFPGYLVSRFSDDHFLLVCVSNHLEEAILQIHDQLHSFGRNANVGLKAGIYVIDDDSLDIGLACDRAKTACDSIAHRYDHIYRWFDDALSWRIERSKYIESHIDRALESGWIKVYYQPIIRAISGEVCEFEALARWDDPHYGMLSPAVFIDVLEQSRLIHKLDAFVIRHVCSEWRKLRSYKKWRIPVSVNLSRLDFELCDAFEMIEAARQEFDVPRQILHLEVTESALNENLELLSANVERFRSAGYQVWLDDFGSGYSSLNTLKDYQFDVVKIDMAFLREFETNPRSRVIIASVVNMAKQLGMHTLIEGVETPEQFDFIRGIGCEFAQGYLIGKPVPSNNNVERLLSGELFVEQSSLHGYYDRLGGINSLSADPFDFPWDGEPGQNMFADILPLAVLEREASEIRFAVVNDAFVKMVRDVGMGTMTQMAARISEGEDGQGRLMRETIRAAVASGDVESVDVLENGRHCVFKVRFIASHDNVDALLVSFMNLSHLSDLEEERRLQIAMRYLYAVYDEVNIISLPQRTVTTIYRGSTTIPLVDSNTPFEEAIDAFCGRRVHPEDRERFIRFMDLSTVIDRANASDGCTIAEAFRALMPTGLYEWITAVIVPIRIDGEDTVLVCVRRANRDVVATMTNSEQIPKSLLWDTLVELVPAGIFWKDADRRFVGVNKNFLDFYDFDSVNDVLGKNDEEMGWHVDTDPFKNNELRVLEGDSVINAHGTCLARGGVREILASKIPLWRNGEVVGMLGYFTDQTKPSESTRKLIFDGFDRMAETDQLTGILNLKGLASSAVTYQESYEDNGLDFAGIILDIDGMSALNSVHGRSFGNQVLKAVARTLTKASGVSGSVARIGGDKFAALKQVTSEDEVAQATEQLIQAVRGIHEVAGVKIRLHCFVGAALFSEREDLSSMLDLAEQRMRKDERHT
ncbi:MAG: EAL domain-containing protein [Atopobiaceae bacterium]|nr:EAL domain-containing protein [Atopobiaceae bacterium]